MIFTNIARVTSWKRLVNIPVTSQNVNELFVLVFFYSPSYHAMTIWAEKSA